jgi:hypothetical protein
VFVVGTSPMGLGLKVREAGAEPGERVWALNSGTLSASEVLRPGWCWEECE